MNRTLFVSLLVLLSVGCASVKPDTQEELPVDFLSEDVAKAVEVVSHRAERLPSGHVDVMLGCVSTEEKKPVWFDWKVIFFDQRDIPVDESEWHSEQLFPKREKLIRASSIRTDIGRYRFLLRSPM
ncbi:MAG: hypothetical protein V2J65_14940 [Desulfobacteraceae bacterium]|nr:hypothetical protein [Desulfobacteraceae bacterium]